MKTRFLMLSIILLAPVVAMAKPHIVISTLQKSIYENPECKPEGLPKGACLTECEISYPVIDGIEAMAMQKALNAKFEKKALAARCEGKKVAVGLTEDFFPSKRSYVYKLLLNDGALIGLSEETYEFSSGAAHGTYATAGVIIDARTGKELTTDELLNMDQLEALNAYLVERIQKDERVFDNIRKTPAANLPPYISKDKRDFTLMLSEERGLYALFGIYQIGPYSSGEIDYDIPRDFIKHPAILKLIDDKELRDAQR